MYWQLILVFGALSVLGFGGGKAIVPQMQVDVVTQHHWVTALEFSKYYAISKLATGATNSLASLVGWTAAGAGGAAVATCAIFGPSSVLMYFLGAAWQRYREHPWRDLAAQALGPIVVGLSWAGIYSIAQGAIDVPWTYAIAAGTTAVCLFTRLHAGVILLGAGIAGALLLR
jgi:chromate transporter